MNHELPPGFRFHPTDEELIVYYLQNQAMSRPCPVSIISELDIYKFDPWQLTENAKLGEKEWYFFTLRSRKYLNGARPNRAAVSGYWKATGSDKAIYSGSKHVGVKKSLVFYKGRPPKGLKTDWIMHEYRLADSRTNVQHRSMKLDWVLCRIYKKQRSSKSLDRKVEDFHGQSNRTMTNEASDKQVMRLPNFCSLTPDLLQLDYFGPISQFLIGSSYHPTFDGQNIIVDGEAYGAEKKLQLHGNKVSCLYADQGKL